MSSERYLKCQTIVEKWFYDSGWVATEGRATPAINCAEKAWDSALQSSEVTKLREENRVMRKALKESCFCPGELNYDGKEILCDACEALEKLK
jgi:hypothetical protein